MQGACQGLVGALRPFAFAHAVPVLFREGGRTPQGDEIIRAERRAEP